MNRRIFIISPTESCLTRRGNRHPLLAAQFVAAGWEVVYVSTDFYHAEKRYFSHDEISAAKSQVGYELKLFHVSAYGDNISFLRLWGYVSLAIKSFFFLLKRLRKNDVLLVPCRPPEILLAVRILKQWKKVKLVMDVRDIWPDGLPLGNSLSHRLFAGYCRLLNWLSAPGADLAFYTANGFCAWLFRYVPRTKAHFIPLGFDEKRWCNAKTLSTVDFPDDKIRLVFVGDLAQSMEITALVEAIAAHPRWTLTFIGGGERLDEMKRLVKKLDSKNIFFQGRMSMAEVTAAMRDFHISVVPLKVKFSMPNKLFDALGALRPLLVYGENDAADFAITNKIGWQLQFDAGMENGFLDRLGPSDIIAASRKIEEIRSAYSKGYLYNQMARTIEQLVSVGHETER